MNPFIKERYLHFLLYLGLAYFCVLFAEAVMHFSKFPPGEIWAKYAIPAIVGLIAACSWEMYREGKTNKKAILEGRPTKKTFDKIDVVWSVLGAPFGTWLALNYYTAIWLIIAALCIFGSIGWWLFLQRKK